MPFPMVRLDLALSAALAATAASAFFVVAHRRQAREVPPDLRHVTRLFAAWWAGVGLYALLVGGLLNLLAAFGLLHLPFFTAVHHVAFPLLLASLACLTYYFVFLLTGSRAALAWIAGAYVLAYGVVLFLMAGRRVAGVATAPWSARLVYDPPLEGLPLLAVLAIVLVPQVLGAAVYLLSAFRLPDAGPRYRAVLVAGGIVAWFLSTFLADVLGDHEARFLVRPVLGLAAALCVLLAYDPPDFVLRRLPAEEPGRPPRA